MTITNIGHDFHLEDVDPPPANPDDTRPLSQRNHYYCKATCPCGWESRVYQTWGFCSRAWQKHRTEAKP